jgi:hypothetical protein
MEETIKQEGDFKIKKARVPVVKDASVQSIAKVDLTIKPEDNAIQEQTTDEGVLQSEQSPVGLQEVVEGNTQQEGIANQGEEQEIVVVNIETNTEEAKELEAEADKAINDLKVSGKPLPENVEKLIAFMEETGGDINDYTRLNTDYSKVDPEVLLKEYYKKTKPHLDLDEIDFHMEETFSYDEDEDDEREIKKKRIAFKEEVGKAKNFLEDLKSKYYDEIKLKSNVNPDQQKAIDFFNRYKEDQQSVEQMHSTFKDNTKKFFTQDFKGFDFNAGGKTFRFNLQNTDAIADKQSNITNLLKKFLNDKGEVTDMTGYHKAMYAAENTDSIANHFYEQGKADAIKEMLAKSNNISTEPRQTSSGEINVAGFKVKSINGVDSTKLKIRSKF